MAVNKLIPLLVVFLFSENIFTQSNEQKIVAVIGSDEITADELLERYELTPQINAGIIGAEESLKKELLYSIIAEKLWALEAEAMGLANSELIKSTYKAVEKMYVRDALYKEEILSKVRLTDECLTEAFRRNSQILKLNYLFSPDQEEIKKLYELMINGAPFDSLLLQRPESSLQNEPYFVTYGKMEKDAEDSLYKLKPGEYTKPIKAPNGWYIFKLLSTEEKIIENAEQAEAEQKNVLKIAEATIIDSVYKDFYSRFFANARAETNGELFLELSDLVIKTLNDTGKYKNISDGDNIYLNSEDLYKMENELGAERLNAEFIRLDDEPATLNDFLQELAFEKFSIDTLDNNQIKGRLNFFVKRFIEHELLAREGYRRGLQNLPEVQRYLNIWKSFYLSEALRKEISKSIEVSDEEASKYFKEKNQDSAHIAEVKIIEILTEDLDVLRVVLDEFRDGAEFRELALKYTIREEAKNNNGELGFFPISEYGELGRIASTMKIGDMYGPVKVPEGYSLFKLIDKKEENNLSGIDFEKVKEKIKVELKYQKFSNEIINKTVELVNKYGVTINQDVINSLKVLNTTSVVYRNFGFGGRIPAVPMTLPNHLWVKPWQEQKDLTP